MIKLSCIQIAYVQTIERSNLPMSRLSCFQSCLCPDYRAFKLAYVETIVRSKLPMSRLSCIQICLCPDYRAFKFAYVQTIMRSKLPMFRLSCVQSCLRSVYHAFKVAFVQIIVRSKLPMARLSRVQSCLCLDYLALKDTYVQTFVRSLVFPDRVILNARHPACAFISVWTYRLSVWHLNLGEWLMKNSGRIILGLQKTLVDRYLVWKYLLQTKEKLMTIKEFSSTVSTDELFKSNKTWYGESHINWSITFTFDTFTTVFFEILLYNRFKGLLKLILSDYFCCKGRLALAPLVQLNWKKSDRVPPNYFQILFTFICALFVL